METNNGGAVASTVEPTGTSNSEYTELVIFMYGSICILLLLHKLQTF